MQRWSLATALSIGLSFAILLSVPAAATTNSYTEDFTTTTYKDTNSTSADWNTAAGELRLFPFVRTGWMRADRAWPAGCISAGSKQEHSRRLERWSC